MTVIPYVDRIRNSRKKKNITFMKSKSFYLLSNPHKPKCYTKNEVFTEKCVHFELYVLFANCGLCVAEWTSNMLGMHRI